MNVTDLRNGATAIHPEQLHRSHASLILVYLPRSTPSHYVIYIDCASCNFRDKSLKYLIKIKKVLYNFGP
jgi:hypothetical protein